MVFLQLYYFEASGGSRGWVDKTLAPIQAWGVAEAMQLIRWVEQRARFRDLNTAVWAPITLNPFGDGWYENIGSMAPATRRVLISKFMQIRWSLNWSK